MKISILLPYKENFSYDKAGAVSLYVKDISANSFFKNNIKIYGDTISKNKLLKNFVHLDTGKRFYLSKTNAYIDEFIKYEQKQNSDIIEIHNRPSYLKQIKKFTNSKIIIYFHNDPLSMKGSISENERINLINETNKIVFNSNWCKARFLNNLKGYRSNEKIIVIPQSTSKVNVNFLKKKKIISFVGKLNYSKGYDAFGKAVVRILNKYKDWNSIVIGDEPREKHIFNHKRLKIYGFKSNNFILNKLKSVSISIVPSRWDEPFGRSSLEASSRGCALIMSDKGGLKETTKFALVIKKINENEIYKSLKKLIENDKLRKKLQKSTYSGFYLTNDYVSKKIDQLRKNLINFELKNINKKSLNILHITNLNERFDGRLHYNTGKRITNGFVRLGHNVLTMSDRDIISKSKSVSDFSGVKTLNKKIINTQINFKADIIVLGHVDNISEQTIKDLKKINNSRICQWFLDPLIKNGPDYQRNKKRIKNFDSIIDATFLTTHPSALDFKIKNSYFIPNPCDVAFETLKNYNNKLSKDLFFAMSHGVHRGVLKGGKYDYRETFLKNLKKNLKNIKFDIFGMDSVQPIWGDIFLKTISNYKMGLNLSRGKPIKYYSSDRIVQLIGNGLLTFIDKKTKLDEIISPKGVIYYDNIKDLIKKIKYYNDRPNEIKKIASIGKKEYFRKFNSSNVCRFILEKSLNLKSNNKYFWS